MCHSEQFTEIKWGLLTMQPQKVSAPFACGRRGDIACHGEVTVESQRMDRSLPGWQAVWSRCRGPGVWNVTLNRRRFTLEHRIGTLGKNSWYLMERRAPPFFSVISCLSGHITGLSRCTARYENSIPSLQLRELCPKKLDSVVDFDLSLSTLCWIAMTVSHICY